MTVSEELERLIKIHRPYYDININGEGPFCVTAVFRSHDSHYFLSKRFSIGEAEMNEYVYIATAEILDLKTTEKLITSAWEMGLEKVRPSENHRNSDIVLIILAERITENAAEFIKKCKLFKSYNFLFQGWSVFKIIALDTSTGNYVTNKRGRDLKKLFKS